MVVLQILVSLLVKIVALAMVSVGSAEKDKCTAEPKIPIWLAGKNIIIIKKITFLS